MKFRVEEPTVIDWIGYNEVCIDACFVFDQPIKVDPDDILELTDGCWYLISHGIRAPLHGKWDR